MTTYERELQRLKPHDEVQGTSRDGATGLGFIRTAGHGYLAVPIGHRDYLLAVAISSYGYVGDHAVYLEEDSEAAEFTKRMTR